VTVNSLLINTSLKCQHQSDWFVLEYINKFLTNFFWWKWCWSSSTRDNVRPF